MSVRFPPPLLCFALFAARPAAAGVAVLLSKDNAMYRQAAEAFDGAALHVLPPEDGGVQKELERVKKGKPAAVVAVGSRAAVLAIQALPDTPLVYMMIVYPDKLGLTDRAKTYGVAWLPSAKALGQAIRRLLPDAKRAGVVSSAPRELKAALQAGFRESGLELVVAPVRDASEIPSALRSLRGRVDLLWMGPDPALSNENSYEIFKSYALQEKAPLLVPFALPEGSQAVAGFAVTPQAAGAAAARLLRRVLEGAGAPEGLLYADEIQLTVDLRTAQAVGARIPEPAIKAAAKVYR